MSKEFVLSTDAAVSVERITMRFDSDNEVTVPMVLLEELYHYAGIPEKAKVAQNLLEHIQSFEGQEIISEAGCRQENGSIIRVVDNGQKIDTRINKINNLNTQEKRILQICLERMKKRKNMQVVLISQNMPLRMKAASLGITAQALKDEIFPKPEDQYTGRQEVSVSQSTMNTFFKEGSISVKSVYQYKDIDWNENLFVLMKSETGASAIGRHTDQKIVKLRYLNESSCKADNVEQKMLIECLLAPPEIAPLVVVKGAAGTGKTFCSLSVGLDKLVNYGDAGIYSQILVATPIVTIEEEIGFLPGDIDDKVSPYLGGIKDNLRMIFKKGNEREDNASLDDRSHELFNRKFIQIQSIGHLRGRSIPNTFFIVDETQNIQPSILLDIVTRAAKGTKIVMLGDPTQVNRPGLNTRRNGLVYISEKMKGNSLCWQITLNSEKSIRSKLAQEALKIL